MSAGNAPSHVPHFDPALFGVLSRAETSHFWFRARSKVIAALAKRAVADLPVGYRVLEIGCGPGAVLRILEESCERGHITGIEPFSEAVELARSRARRARVIKADVWTEAFSEKSEKFDVVGMFDVLEHIEDDLGALRRVHGLLRPGGRLLLTVPAHQFLWSYFDELSGHQRRYDKRTLRTRLHEAEFEVEYVSEFFTLLLPVVWVSRLVRGNGRGAAPSNPVAVLEREFKASPLMNGIASRLLGTEAFWVARKVALPFGTSIAAIARAV
jgi:SAM-dependent methyltransferase